MTKTTFIDRATCFSNKTKIDIFNASVDGNTFDFVYTRIALDIERDVVVIRPSTLKHVIRIYLFTGEDVSFISDMT